MSEAHLKPTVGTENVEASKQDPFGLRPVFLVRPKISLNQGPPSVIHMACDAVPGSARESCSFLEYTLNSLLQVDEPCELLSQAEG